MFKGFLLALSFLSLFPLKREFQEKDYKFALFFFPFIGTLLGASAGLVGQLASQLFPDQVSVLLVLIYLIFITAALHLDGLADTFDALGSGKSSAEKLELMRRPEIGAFGTVAVFSILLSKYVLLLKIQNLSLALLVSMTVSRFVPVMAVTFFHYARQDGKAKIFFLNASRLGLFFPTLYTGVILSYLLGKNGIYLMITVVLIMFLFLTCLSNKLNGITGDVLGASVELSEIIGLLFLVACLEQLG